MILQCYADESGRINPSNPAKGDLAPVVCGYIDTPENWTSFSKKWKKALNDYGARYFHFRAFADREDKWKIQGNPFLKWSDKKRHKFLYHLAYLCSESAIPDGTVFDVLDHLSLRSMDDPTETSIVNFFKSFQITMDRHFPNFADKVTFVFDKCDDKDWILPIHKVHADFSARDPRIGGLVFEKDEIALPLQAADLLAYSFHQKADKFLKSKRQSVPPMRSLDFILQRNLDPKLRQMELRHWQVVKEWIYEDEIFFRRSNPGVKYNPIEHFKVEKYVSRLRRTGRV